MTTIAEIKHFHLFCGLGGGARGFNQGEARVGNMQARFRCIGGVDVDRAAIADFGRLAGMPGTCLDMFDREQYLAFHGHEPPSDWREAGPDAIRRAAGGERPHIVFLSAPCKGFSGLLSETRSKTGKYQALNRLTLRGVWLMLEAWADHDDGPPELIVFENVPRIATRGRQLLDQIGALLRSYGYAVAETTHDCGELEAQLCAQLVEHPGRKALLLVLAELRKAKAKHPHFADDLGQACTVLLSEAGELATAVLRAQAFGPHGAMEEAAQVAAVCLRLIEMLQGREVPNA